RVRPCFTKEGLSMHVDYSGLDSEGQGDEGPSVLPTRHANGKTNGHANGKALSGVHERDRDWKQVTPQSPCVICEHDSWCQTDGELAMCRREDAGAFQSKTDSNGVEYHLHRISGEYHPTGNGNGHAIGTAAKAKPPKSKPKAAEVETLDAVYS